MCFSYILLASCNPYSTILANRDGSRGVSLVSRNHSGLLNWHNIPIHSNKTVKINGQYSNTVVVILLITSIYMFILIYACLPEGDL